MWNSIFTGQFQRAVDWQVEPVYLPVNLTWPAVRVRVSSTTAPISWRVAGELVQIFDPFGGLDVEGGSVTLPLNACKIIRFPEIESEEYYSLKFYPKRWIESYEIQIDHFA
ncbi:MULTISPECIES: hypothetical protein [unclassified Microcoleus]|uniref:hypothetical protein n=1 Tax=unclassified Microcoleus TaxID=2642155 RepID=UPI002FD38CD3